MKRKHIALMVLVAVIVLVVAGYILYKNDRQETPATYSCPVYGWVDCMPGPEAKPECSPEAMIWYKTNCPNFQGGAL